MIFRESSLITPSFSWDAAASLASACQVAYRSEGAVRAEVKRAGMSVLQIIAAGATEGFVAESPGVILVAFRGTNSTSDWLANLDLRRKERQWGIVHQGFFRAYSIAAVLLRNYLDRARRGNKAFWLTGHSLGGALAQIAAQELAGTYSRIGLCTFGQPRTANVLPAFDISVRLGLKYHRVVNGRDYVTRVPPNFGHTGRLIHLTNGIEGFAEDENIAATSKDELPPLDIAEFERDKAQLQLLRAEIGAKSFGIEAGVSTQGPPAGAEGWLLDASAERFLPGINDHAIGEYVRRIALNVKSETRKEKSSVEVLRNLASPGLKSVGRMDPARLPRDGLQTLSRDRISSALPREIFAPQSAPSIGFGVEMESAADGEAVLLSSAPHLSPVVIRIASSVWIPPDGVQEQSRIGAFVTVLASESGITALREDATVTQVEMSRDAGIAELDRSLPFVRCDGVQRPPTDERGDAALVGIVDTGVDILHRAFRDTSGRTRILALWNQRDARGRPPSRVDPAFPQRLGSLYLAADIQAMIDATEAGGPAPDWTLRDGGDGHGTHVAGIAAGSATTVCGPGMAPEAGLVVVVPNMMTAAGDPHSLGYSVSHLDALAFLKTAALGGNAVVPGGQMPIAINMSLGMNAGAHDGSTLLEAAIDALTGGGRDPGIVLVKSAGNERTTCGHASEILFQGLMDLKWESLDVDRDLDFFEGWFAMDNDVAFTLVGPTGGRTAQASLANRRVTEVVDGNLCQIELTRAANDNGESRLIITISPEAVSIRRGQWTLEIEGNQINANSSFHLWVEWIKNRGVRFIRDDETTTISIPGTARHVFTVSASDIGDRPRLTGSSSLGLTRDGRAKPDIAAPGEGIVSARANDSDLEAVVPKTGTSMAAPHVTGALALAMSRRAKSGKLQFNASQLSHFTIATARRVGMIFHPGWGNGILDTAALLATIDQEP